MTDAHELSYCPFCGAEEIGHSLGNNYGRQVCMICCAQGPLVEGNPETEQFWDDMTSEWNTRADLHATDAQAMQNEKVKALVRALKKSRTLTCEACETGFNPRAGDWAERMFEHNGVISAALRAIKKGQGND